MKKVAITALATMVLCVGCTALDVDVERAPGECATTGTCSATQDLKGFPFNVKVPRRVQTTKIAVPVIVVEIKTSAGGAPLAAPIEMRGSGHLNQVIKEVDVAASESKGLADVTSRLEALARSAPTVPAAGPELQQAALPQLEGARTVSNMITVEAVLSEKQYYFSPRMPIAGSAAATVKPGPDGTLSEASVNVTDKTLEVLPSLIPLKEMILARQMKGPKDRSGKRKSGPTVVVSLATEIYILRRMLPPDTLTAKPLTLGEVDDGKVELVSIAKVVAEPSAPEKPAYSITGKITLPDPPK